MKTQYFGESGLTSTSANYICNLAKESYEKLEAKLNATSFLEEYITIIGARAETRISLASTELLDTATNMLKEIYNLKSLIAWLREAIKEKENLFKANKFFESAEYTALMANKPVRKAYLTEQDVIESWTVKEQEEYLSLETRCAVIGKYIHPNGPLSRAKKDLSFRLSHPIVTECSGRDTIVRRYQAVTTEEEVDALFFSLQNKHRELQAQLNGIEAGKKLLKDFMTTYRDKKYARNPGTMDDFLTELLLQKRVEFWGEGIVFFDYKRCPELLHINRGYKGTNHPELARFNCDGLAPWFNVPINGYEAQDNKALSETNNPDPTNTVALWVE